MRNAGHWYGRAERELPEASAVDQEIRSLKRELESG